MGWGESTRLPSCPPCLRCAPTPNLGLLKWRRLCPTLALLSREPHKTHSLHPPPRHRDQLPKPIPAGRPSLPPPLGAPPCPHRPRGRLPVLLLLLREALISRAWGIARSPGLSWRGTASQPAGPPLLGGHCPSSRLRSVGTWQAEREGVEHPLRVPCWPSFLPHLQPGGVAWERSLPPLCLPDHPRPLLQNPVTISRVNSRPPGPCPSFMGLSMAKPCLRSGPHS